MQMHSLKQLLMPVYDSAPQVPEVTLSILPAASMHQQRIVLQVTWLRPHVTAVQGANFSWLGYPGDTVPSSRDFVPGLTAQQQNEGGGHTEGAEGGQTEGEAGVSAEEGEEEEGSEGSGATLGSQRSAAARSSSSSSSISGASISGWQQQVCVDPKKDQGFCLHVATAFMYVVPVGAAIPVALYNPFFVHAYMLSFGCGCTACLQHAVACPGCQHVWHVTNSCLLLPASPPVYVICDSQE